MAQQNTSIVLNERPKTDIIPGQTFRTESKPVPKADDLKDGEILVESLYLSLDPAMRGWLNGQWAGSPNPCSPFPMFSFLCVTSSLLINPVD